MGKKKKKSGKRCRFCGGKVDPDAFVCPHCQESLKAEPVPETGGRGTGLIRLDKWSEFRVPAWAMYVALAFGVYAVFVLTTGACRPKPKIVPFGEEVEDSESKEESRIIDPILDQFEPSVRG